MLSKGILASISVISFNGVWIDVAQAQAVEELRALLPRYSLDERGVDLASGNLSYSLNEIAIGNLAQGGLSHGRMLRGGVWVPSTESGITSERGFFGVVIEGAETPYDRRNNNRPFVEDGSTLVRDADGNFIHTSNLGVVRRFRPSDASLKSPYGTFGLDPIILRI